MSYLGYTIFEGDITPLQKIPSTCSKPGSQSCQTTEDQVMPRNYSLLCWNLSVYIELEYNREAFLAFSSKQWRAGTVLWLSDAGLDAILK